MCFCNAWGRYLAYYLTQNSFPAENTEQARVLAQAFLERGAVYMNEEEGLGKHQILSHDCNSLFAILLLTAFANRQVLF